MAASRNSPSPDLADAVGRFLADHAPPGRLGVGLSGGLDSVVLLHLLHRVMPCARLVALHVHHGLSPEADRWAAFCVDYCQGLGVDLQITRVAVRVAGQGVEAAARAARYQAFADSGLPGIVLAQHRRDQAETILFNLLRGSGVYGAAAMRPFRLQGRQLILRPLLDLPRTSIEAYARAHSLNWVEDESNRDTRFSRNFLRHEVLTAIEARFPGAEATLARAAGHFAEAASLLDELAEQDWSLVAEADAACLAGLRRLKPERLKNLLRWRLQYLGWRVPVASRLDEFARQLATAAADRHPELLLADGCLRVAGRRLHWQPRE